MTNGEENQIETHESFISARRIVILVLFGIVVYLVMILYFNYERVASAIATIPWWWAIPGMMGLSFCNYIIRYVKWQYYLRRIDIDLSHPTSFSIFLAGFTLTATPGKIGEAIKGYFIKEKDGTPIAKTVPVVVSERVTDLLAMVLLAMIGFLFGFSGGDQLLIVLVLGGLVFCIAIILGHSAFYDKFLKRMMSFGPLKRFQDSCELVEDTMTKTLSPKPMVLSTLVSIPGWFMECLELWLLLSLLSGAGFPSLLPGSILILVYATFIHSTASVIGAVILTPGGLGAYEATAVILIQLLLAVGGDIASAATILIRFVTLWFSVIVGFLALSIVTRKKG